MSWPAINLSFLSLRGRKESRPLGMMWMFSCSIISSLLSLGQKIFTAVSLPNPRSCSQSLNPVFQQFLMSSQWLLQTNKITGPYMRSYNAGKFTSPFFFFSPKDDNAPVLCSNQSSSEGQLMAEFFSLAGRKPNRDLNKEQPLYSTYSCLIMSFSPLCCSKTTCLPYGNINSISSLCTAMAPIMM